jgi:hypothetical protein
MRYDAFQTLINAHHPGSIVEVGTWDGRRAMALAEQALKFRERVHYVGFDLFEGADAATDERELNVKKHNTIDEVTDRLREFAKDHTGFTFELFGGDTRETLPDWAVGAKQAMDEAKGDFQIDLAFIDGGHSVATVQSDYNALKDICRVMVLDDFYEADANGVIPDIARYGCNSLLEGKDYAVLPGADPVMGGGLVRMVCLPRETWPENQNIKIKTKNCVRDEFIQANIRFASGLTDKWITQCRPHDLEAVIVSGGPSRLDFMPEIRNFIAHKEAARVFCVKTSHDWLIENEMIPWGCLLLDPRPHVLDFVDQPHEAIKYFTASMCHPVTVQRLVEKDAEIWGYHAHVGAGEKETVKKQLGEGMIIGGGSTAALRGVSVLHALGFRKFTLIGFDSCYSGPDDKVHGIKSEKPIFQVETNGAKFWTDAELLAQAQDFVTLMEVSQDVDLNVLGPGMIKHVWDTTDKKLPGGSFGDLFGE